MFIDIHQCQNLRTHNVSNSIVLEKNVSKERGDNHNSLFRPSPERTWRRVRGFLRDNNKTYIHDCGVITACFVRSKSPSIQTSDCFRLLCGTFLLGALPLLNIFFSTISNIPHTALGSTIQLNKDCMLK